MTRAIVFSATKRDADSLARELTSEGYTAAPLHADMTQSARNKTLADMRRGKIRLLVATDVAARGLDITGISHVINFDLPHSAEDYVNRIGRTGRAGESGVAISLASRGDFPYLDRIERYLGENLAVTVIPGLEPAHPVSRGSGGQRSGSKAPGNGNGSPVRTGRKRFGNHSKASGGSSGPGGEAAGKAKRTAQSTRPRNGGGVDRRTVSSPAPASAARKPNRKSPVQRSNETVKERSVS
jgi:superfamily II DNA/RNA helicase